MPVFNNPNQVFRSAGVQGFGDQGEFGASALAAFLQSQRGEEEETEEEKQARLAGGGAIRGGPPGLTSEGIQSLVQQLPGLLQMFGIGGGFLGGGGGGGGGTAEGGGFFSP
jgi:hypothetical protein